MRRRYFTDRDLGKQFPYILSESGIVVERHGELFPPDGSDEQWLEYCGLNRLVAITHNSRIRYVPNELAAVIKFNVMLLVVVGQAPSGQLANNFVRTIDRVEAMIDSRQPPFIAKIYSPTPSQSLKSSVAPGRIELWYPKKQEP